MFHVPAHKNTVAPAAQIHAAATPSYFEVEEIELFAYVEEAETRIWISDRFSRRIDDEGDGCPG
jgi:hypothetical protein